MIDLLLGELKEERAERRRLQGAEPAAESAAQEQAARPTDQPADQPADKDWAAQLEHLRRRPGRLAEALAARACRRQTGRRKALEAAGVAWVPENTPIAAALDAAEALGRKQA